ncbi:Fe-S-containing protein [Campylobacter sp. MG1]|uniref:Fe-S-containing protein n=1 Tax=Campylobacter sp. MG1 TaxID=2976332 RepID=UPI00226D0706|nr:Fe-S-containing protein [Campylobacter sp. MG1]
MSIYFMHLFLEAFVISFFVAFVGKNNSVFKVLISALVGFIFGYIAFYIINYEKQNKIGLIIADSILIVSLIMVFLRNFKIISFISSILLTFACSIRYFLMSSNFPIFESNLLDTQGVFNFAFILLAIFVCFVFFISFTYSTKHSKSKLNLFIAIILALMFINECLAELALYGMKTRSLGVLSDSDLLLSYIGKSKHYVEFYYYICLILAIIYVGLCLKLRPKFREKRCDFDIEYRKNKHLINTINIHFSITFLLSVVSFLVIIYYDLVASKPISIDEPLVITPKSKDYFEFNLQEVSDGKLHRYAYISSSGKKIRFFIINRFKGKITPVAVFDSCMICGDLGYILQNDELICVACNVRLFLPSVGKAGGCNPIPLEYEIDEKNNKFLIKISEIINGENYFSEIVEVEVIDPVNGDKFINLKAKKSYMYNGINYYFSTDKSYEEFKQNPDKYVSTSDIVPFRINGYQS